MISLDTNVIVRFLMNDDKAQAARAKKLISTNEVFLSPTVLLEAEWVLRAAYEVPDDEIAAMLRALIGISTVTTSNPDAIAEALAAFESGLDFADALHLALSGPAQSFATFDAALIKRSRGSRGRAVVAP